MSSCQKNDASGKLRPRSIVNVLAVIIDKLHQARMDVLISQDPALKDRFGFIHNRSCEDVVGLLLSEVEKDKLINYKCALLQLDLSAAYAHCTLRGKNGPLALEGLKITQIA